MHHKYLICLIGLLLLSACGGDAVDKKLPIITKLEDGRYEVMSAKRNGKETGTLSKAFYEVRNDSVFTNLTKNLDLIATTFELRNNNISHKNENALNFVVSKMTSDSLELNTELQGFTFEIYLSKAKNNINEN